MPLKELLKCSSDSLLTHGGTPVPFSSLANKYVLLYFSAHWCGPCRGFTPKFVEWYKTHHSKRNDFEVIFISWDQSEEQFNDYYKEMPWMALPFNDSSREAIGSELGVDGIPTCWL